MKSYTGRPVTSAEFRRSLKPPGMLTDSKYSVRNTSQPTDKDRELEAYFRENEFTNDPGAVARTRAKVKARACARSEELFKEADVRAMGNEVFLAIPDPFANVHTTTSFEGKSQETYCLGRGDTESSGLNKVKSMDEIQDVSSQMLRSSGEANRNLEYTID